MLSRRAWLKRSLVWSAGLLTLNAPKTLGREHHRPYPIAYIGPTRTGESAVQAGNFQVVGTAGLRGAVVASEELQVQSHVLGIPFDLLVADAPTQSSAIQAARRLIQHNDVFAIIGGFDNETSRELGSLAHAQKRLFLNIGCSSDELRRKHANGMTFHIEASASMYIDVLVRWAKTKGYKRWFLVTKDTDEGRARSAVLRSKLREHETEATIVAQSIVGYDQSEFTSVVEQIRTHEPDIVFLNIGPVAQLDFLGQYETAEINVAVTGFPEALTQTRHFYAASRNTAPRSGTNFRATLWDPTLNTPGASQLNDFYKARWGFPIESTSWAAWAAVRIVWEAILEGARTPSEAAAYLRNPATTFDLYKGAPLAFNVEDHQLQQPLYIARIREEATDMWDLSEIAFGGVPVK